MEKTPYNHHPNPIFSTPPHSVQELEQYPSKVVSVSIPPTQRRFWPKPALYWLLPFLGSAIALLGGCAQSPNLSPSQPTNPQTLDNSRRESDTTNKVASNRPLTPTQEDTNFVVDVVKKVEPAVVRINTSQTVRTEMPDGLDDPLFRRFFGGVSPVQPQERVQRGIGSGFVLNAKGLILTNSHVVNKADTVSVVFSDGRTYQGKVLGEDPLTDVAVVQIPANNLPTVELANSDQVQPGQWAIAIGNPLGLQETVTVGVVSAIDRSSSDIQASDKRVSFIQTDAAINPGNSGGPLLNARGQVIGINTAIIQGAQGIGFAIPIDTAKRIADQLITKGRVEHPFLGVQMLPLTPEIKQRLNNSPNSNVRIEADQGVLVVRVVRGSPADQAGIKPGDVIQTINNQPVTKAEQIQQQLEKSGVGSQLPLTVQRGGQTVQLTVRPAPLPTQATQ